MIPTQWLPIKFLRKKRSGRFAPRMRLNAPGPTSGGSSGDQGLASTFPPKSALAALAEWGPANRRGPSEKRASSNISTLKIQ